MFYLTGVFLCKIKPALAGLHKAVAMSSAQNWYPRVEVYRAVFTVR
jgi:hypothetical protein